MNRIALHHRRHSRRRMTAQLPRLAAARQAALAWERGTNGTSVPSAAARPEPPVAARPSPPLLLPAPPREPQPEPVDLPVLAPVLSEAVDAIPTPPVPPSPKQGLPFELATEDGEVAITMPPIKQATRQSVTAEQRRPTLRPSEPIQQPEGPSPEELLYNAAREADAQGERRRATAIYRELLEAYPRHVAARNNLALLLDHRGDHEQALNELQRCLTIDAANPRVLVNRGAVLGALGRYREAEGDLRHALELDGASAEAHFNLGLLMSRKGLWAEALPYLRRSIELDGSQATAYYYLGEALNHVDDLIGALQAYQRAVELGPNNAKAFYGLGIIYDRLNRPDEAAQMYRRSREITGR